MLTLRRMAEPALEQNGVGFLHVERRDSSLVLVGECGKVVLTVSGISVPSKLSAGDREYIISLLQRYFEKHKSAIIPYIEKLLATRDLPDIEAPSIITNGVSYTAGGASTATKNATYYTDGTIILNNTKRNWDNLEEYFTELREEQPIVMKFLNESRERYLLLNELNALGRKVGTCSI